MTRWKNKLEKVSGPHAQSLSDETLTSSLKMGLFDYPVLQPVDILLFKGTHVPVGENQV